MARPITSLSLKRCCPGALDNDTRRFGRLADIAIEEGLATQLLGELHPGPRRGAFGRYHFEMLGPDADLDALPRPGRLRQGQPAARSR